MTIAEYTGHGMRKTLSLCLNDNGNSTYRRSVLGAKMLHEGVMMKQVRKSLHSMSKVHSNGMCGATWLRQPRYR